MEMEFGIVCRTTFFSEEASWNDRTIWHEPFAKRVKLVTTTVEAGSVSLPISTLEMDGKQYPVIGLSTGLDECVVAIFILVDGLKRKLYTDIFLPGRQRSDIEDYVSGRVAAIRNRKMVF